MSLTYGTDAAWDKTYTNDLLNIKGFVFSHTGSSTPWMVYDGFTAANSNDHKEYSDMLAHQFDVIAEGRAPYFIAYWNTMEDNSTLLSKRSCLVYYMEEANDHEEFIPNMWTLQTPRMPTTQCSTATTIAVNSRKVII